jgi:hypothetical protein
VKLDEWLREQLANGPVPTTEQLAAAKQYEDGVLYWTLRKTKGMVVPSEFVRSAAQAAAMR